MEHSREHLTGIWHTYSDNSFLYSYIIRRLERWRSRSLNINDPGHPRTSHEVREMDRNGLLNLIDQKYGERIPGTRIQVPSGQAELSR